MILSRTLLIQSIPARWLLRSFAANSKPIKQGVDLKTSNTLTKKRFSEIFMASLIFKLCSYSLVPRIVVNSSKIPFLGAIVRYGIKKFAFPHFCGGETVEECMISIGNMYRDYNIRSLLDHSVEESNLPEHWADNVNSKIELINLARLRGNGRIHSIPVKCTSIMSPDMLEAITREIENSKNFDDSQLLADLTRDWKKEFDIGKDNLMKLCEHAQLSGVALLLDAEQSYRQPAVELLYRVVSPTFNKQNRVPVLYNTYQMYLKRSSEAVIRDMNYAKSNNCIFAAKIVRGAYCVQERERVMRLGVDDPIRESKLLVDDAYNETLSRLISDISNENGPYIVIATHNKLSILHAINQIAAARINKNAKNIYFAQILGMSDHITIALGREGYNVMKLVCFGEFKDIFPWLSRRFQENQDIFGAMQAERHVYVEEIYRRLAALFY